jgi:hypothetical protein
MIDLPEEANVQKRVKLERVEGGYRYDLGDRVRGGDYCFEIRKIDQSGATFNGWWEVIAGDMAGVGLFQSLDDVRTFLAHMPSPYHRYSR